MTALELAKAQALRARGLLPGGHSGTNCIKIGLPGKLILSKRKGLLEVQFSRK